MASHEYSPREALELLLRKVRERDANLAIGLEAVIDAGKDVFEKETLRTEKMPREYGSPPADDFEAVPGAFRTKKKPREYRKTVRFSDEEALDIALQALRAHFVEQPLLATSAMSEFGKAALEPERDWWDEASVDQSVSPPGEDEPLSVGVEFEIQTETEVAPKDAPDREQTFSLSAPEEGILKEQRKNIADLKALLRFEEGEP